MPFWSFDKSIFGISSKCYYVILTVLISQQSVETSLWQFQEQLSIGPAMQFGSNKCLLVIPLPRVKQKLLSTKHTLAALDEKKGGVLHPFAQVIGWSSCGHINMFRYMVSVYTCNVDQSKNHTCGRYWHVQISSPGLDTVSYIAKWEQAETWASLPHGNATLNTCSFWCHGARGVSMSNHNIRVWLSVSFLPCWWGLLSRWRPGCD